MAILPNTLLPILVDHEDIKFIPPSDATGAALITMKKGLLDIRETVNILISTLDPSLKGFNTIASELNCRFSTGLKHRSVKFAIAMF
jgi:hypothetical protein